MKNNKIKLLRPWTIQVLPLCFMVLQSCGKPGGINAADTTLGGIGQGADYDTISRAILQPKCVSCHSDPSASGGMSFSSYASTMASGAVVANKPDKSQLFTAVNTGVMPKGGAALSGAEIGAISNWILNGALATSGNPIPSPTPTPTSTITATFSSINTSILQPKCTSCHSGSGASGGIDLSSYSSVIAAAVTAGNPSTSKLYTATSGGLMPPGGSQLSSTSLQAISDWITAGAANN